MSLRLRLTLLYTLTLAAVLLIFGALVYSLINSTAINQVDRQLRGNALELIDTLKVSSDGRFDTRGVSEFKTAFPVQYEVWGNDGTLQVRSPLSLTESLDSMSLTYKRTGFSTITHQGESMRVVTIPISNQRGAVGVLQMSMALDLVVSLRSSLAGILLSMALILSVFVAIGSWWLTGRETAPLQRVTNTAERITQVDDLSRRIAIRQGDSSEVTTLIESFNHTLQRMEKLFISQRQFTADVSHELRTPLTVIKGEVGLMRQTERLDAESLRNIDLEVDRLSRLVGEILLFSQAESGNLQLNFSQVEVDTLLLDVYQNAKSLAGEKVKITLDSIDQLTAEADHDRLKQVLLNLVSNALAHTPAGGAVTLGLSKYEDNACIRVSDTGPGISEADLPHIFDRFYRSEKSRTRKESTGFGLGLSIADLIIKKHHGVIRVKSREGLGTTFYVSLPLIQPKTK